MDSQWPEELIERARHDLGHKYGRVLTHTEAIQELNAWGRIFDDFLRLDLPNKGGGNESTSLDD